MTTLMIDLFKKETRNSKLKRCPAIQPIVAAAALFGSPVAFAHVRVAGQIKSCLRVATRGSARVEDR